MDRLLPVQDMTHFSFCPAFSYRTTRKRTIKNRCRRNAPRLLDRWNERATAESPRRSTGVFLSRTEHTSEHIASLSPLFCTHRAYLLRPRTPFTFKTILPLPHPVRSAFLSGFSGLFRETPPFVLPFLPNGSNVLAPLRLFMRLHHVYRTGNVWTYFFSPFCSWRQERC